MPVNTQQAKELLETLAFQEAAETAQHGRQHYSRLARLPVGSWQAETIRQSADIAVAESVETLRAAMQSPEKSLIFIPHTAFVTASVIETICTESPLSKMIIWETGEG